MILAVLVFFLVLAVAGWWLSRAEQKRGWQAEAREELEALARELGGLALAVDADGIHHLRGQHDGVEVRVDHRHVLGSGVPSAPALTCELPELSGAPDVALWVGRAPKFFREVFGAPRRLPIDELGLYDLYTRADLGGSDWWQDVVFLETLQTVAGARLWKRDATLLILFDRLDAESVQAALRLPGQLREAASRPTLH